MSILVPMMMMSVPIVILYLSAKQLLVVLSLGIVLALPGGREEVAELFSEVLAEILTGEGGDERSCGLVDAGEAYLGIVASTLAELFQRFLLDGRLPLLQELPSIHPDILLQHPDVASHPLHGPRIKLFLGWIHVVGEVSNFPDERLHGEFKLVVVAHDGRMADEERC